MMRRSGAGRDHSFQNFYGALFGRGGLRCRKNGKWLFLLLVDGRRVEERDERRKEK
jgi:hypothetical protein